MTTIQDQSMLDKVAGKLRQPASFSEGATGSILTISASRYSAQVDEDLTQPTGFDPQAAALFEAVVESAFLVANADGNFDDVEQDAFKQVVLAACGTTVGEGQLTALLADLACLLEEDGVDKRVRMVAKTVARPDQARDVLRVAGLIAYVSEGVSEVEREVLTRLARAFELDEDAVDATLEDVKQVLAD